MTYFYRFCVKIFLAGILLFPNLSGAVVIEQKMQDPAQEREAREIFKQLRCMTCSGESIYDSRSPLAGNMRKKVRDKIEEGDKPQEIVNYFHSRYGDEILMTPQHNAILLWALPAAVTLLTLLIAICVIRRSAAEKT